METKVPQILPVNILFFTISWLAVLLRVYVRGFLRPAWAIDDWLMLATQAFYTAYLLCQLGGLAYGTGRHIYDLELTHARKALQFWFFCEIFYVVSACLLKISVGFFLLRITLKKYHIRILWIFIVGTGLFGTGYILLTVLQCHPVSDWWMIPERKSCINTRIIADTTYAASSINAIADWVFGLLPIFIVKDLKMSRRMKLIVIGLLSFAAIASISTIIRIPYVYQLIDFDDFLWNSTDLALWSTVEVGVGVVAACFGTLRPLLRVIQIKTGRRPSSYKDSSHLPYTGPSGPDGRATGRNKVYRNSHHRSISLDELRPDLLPNTTVTTITCRQYDDSPPSTSGHPRTGSLDQENSVKVTSVLSKSQPSFPLWQSESYSRETEQADLIRVDMSLMVTYEDKDREKIQNMK